MSVELTPADVDAFIAEVYPASHAGGYRCDEIEEGRTVCRWNYDTSILRPGGFISGPIQFTVADVALWYLSFTVVGLQPMAVTSDLHMTFLRPAAGGDLLGEAHLLRAGRTRISGRVSIWVDGAPERPVAHATGSYGVLRMD